MTIKYEQFPRTILWRRVDVDGMDACSYEPSGDGFLISGTALYQERDDPAKFEYEVNCNSDWSSQSARVSGWLGTTKTEFALSRHPTGSWDFNGEEIGEVSGLLDVDLGFTPATNTNAIRRLDLEIGEKVETTAVWLDTEDWRFKPLRQVYQRLSKTDFSYSSPSHDYAANLVTDEFGIVRIYPGLWTAISE
ncbi:putative glycolipid-binding domain-containing protein [Pararhizobium sp. IMCC21322]|uniref:putative glycolipid-binding domain-containing protein n=1 Tax=Pararhizobium sp. IMCC21322 TaxID=3067903 RepID=UPI0027415B15|nr:putative glycolipid-binding domain-containing protein [Pararhizobium sp. IMCC21322]